MLNVQMTKFVKLGGVSKVQTNMMKMDTTKMDTTKMDMMKTDMTKMDMTKMDMMKMDTKTKVKMTVIVSQTARVVLVGAMAAVEPVAPVIVMKSVRKEIA